MITIDQLNELFVLTDDGRLLWRHDVNVNNRHRGKLAGAIVTNIVGNKYCHIKIKGRFYKRSHLVFCLTRGALPLLHIDHINGDSLDDRPSNLREATVTQNAWNHRTRAKKSDTPMGVNRCRRAKGRTVYEAQLIVNKKRMKLGVFETAEAASAAYRLARHLYYGEFSGLKPAYLDRREAEKATCR